MGIKQKTVAHQEAARFYHEAIKIYWKAEAVEDNPGVCTGMITDLLSSTSPKADIRFAIPPIKPFQIQLYLVELHRSFTCPIRKWPF